VAELDDHPELRVRDLEVAFSGPAGEVRVAQKVSFELRKGTTLGIVGESGCGKSVTLRALCSLVPAPGRVVGGSIELQGRTCSRDDLVAARGKEIAMIFQDPSSSLNPVISIGSHIEEVLRVKRGMKSREARVEAQDLLDRVGIPDPAARLRAYPHELSGGMRQRVMIAMALAARPRILLADEPTTALDVTTQEQILQLLLTLQDETGMAMVIVTHDLAVVADVCDDVVVMYAGYVVERGSCADVLTRPKHPYTRRLLEAMPRLTGTQLPFAIPGQPPDLAALPPGCPFEPRCSEARPACKAVDMEAESATDCACPFASPVNSDGDAGLEKGVDRQQCAQVSTSD
jgi:oligopeptide/dipeptide ABC transporter ATP-binding protein